jgi:hypothetical protein
MKAHENTGMHANSGIRKQDSKVRANQDWLYTPLFLLDAAHTSKRTRVFKQTYEANSPKGFST